MPSISQGTSGVPEPGELDMGMERALPQSREGSSPANTLILDL